MKKWKRCMSILLTVLMLSGTIFDAPVVRAAGPDDNTVVTEVETTAPTEEADVSEETTVDDEITEALQEETVEEISEEDDALLDDALDEEIADEEASDEELSGGITGEISEADPEEEDAVEADEEEADVADDEEIGEIGEIGEIVDDGDLDPVIYLGGSGGTDYFRGVVITEEEFEDWKENGGSYSYVDDENTGHSQEQAETLPDLLAALSADSGVTQTGYYAVKTSEEYTADEVIQIAEAYNSVDTKGVILVADQYYDDTRYEDIDNAVRTKGITVPAGVELLLTGGFGQSGEDFTLSGGGTVAFYHQDMGGAPYVSRLTGGAADGTTVVFATDHINLESLDATKWTGGVVFKNYGNFFVDGDFKLGKTRMERSIRLYMKKTASDQKLPTFTSDDADFEWLPETAMVTIDGTAVEDCELYEKCDEGNWSYYLKADIGGQTQYYPCSPDEGWHVTSNEFTTTDPTTLGYSHRGGSVSIELMFYTGFDISNRPMWEGGSYTRGEQIVNFVESGAGKNVGKTWSDGHIILLCTKPDQAGLHYEDWDQPGVDINGRVEQFRYFTAVMIDESTFETVKSRNIDVDDLCWKADRETTPMAESGDLETLVELLRADSAAKHVADSGYYLILALSARDGEEDVYLETTDVLTLPDANIILRTGGDDYMKIGGIEAAAGKEVVLCGNFCGPGDEKYAAATSDFTIQGSGKVTIASRWGETCLPKVQLAGSADVHFLAGGGYIWMYELNAEGKTVTFDEAEYGRVDLFLGAGGSTRLGGAVMNTNVALNMLGDHLPSLKSSNVVFNDVQNGRWVWNGDTDDQSNPLYGNEEPYPLYALNRGTEDEAFYILWNDGKYYAFDESVEGKLGEELTDLTGLEQCLYPATLSITYIDHFDWNPDGYIEWCYGKDQKEKTPVVDFANENVGAAWYRHIRVDVPHRDPDMSKNYEVNIKGCVQYEGAFLNGWVIDQSQYEDWKDGKGGYARGDEIRSYDLEILLKELKAEMGPTGYCVVEPTSEYWDGPKTVKGHYAQEGAVTVPEGMHLILKVNCGYDDNQYFSDYITIGGVNVEQNAEIALDGEFKSPNNLFMVSGEGSVLICHYEVGRTVLPFVKSGAGAGTVAFCGRHGAIELAGLDLTSGTEKAAAFYSRTQLLIGADGVRLGAVDLQDDVEIDMSGRGKLPVFTSSDVTQTTVYETRSLWDTTTEQWYDCDLYRIPGTEANGWHEEQYLEIEGEYYTYDGWGDQYADVHDEENKITDNGKKGEIAANRAQHDTMFDVSFMTTVDLEDPQDGSYFNPKVFTNGEAVVKFGADSENDDAIGYALYQKIRISALNRQQDPNDMNNFQQMYFYYNYPDIRGRLVDLDLDDDGDGDAPIQMDMFAGSTPQADFEEYGYNWELPERPFVSRFGDFDTMVAFIGQQMQNDPTSGYYVANVRKDYVNKAETLDLSKAEGLLGLAVGVENTKEWVEFDLSEARDEEDLEDISPWGSCWNEDGTIEYERFGAKDTTDDEWKEFVKLPGSGDDKYYVSEMKFIRAEFDGFRSITVDEDQTLKFYEIYDADYSVNKNNTPLVINGEGVFEVMNGQFYRPVKMAEGTLKAADNATFRILEANELALAGGNLFIGEKLDVNKITRSRRASQLTNDYLQTGDLSHENNAHEVFLFARSEANIGAIDMTFRNESEANPTGQIWEKLYADDINFNLEHGADGVLPTLRFMGEVKLGTAMQYHNGDGNDKAYMVGGLDTRTVRDSQFMFRLFRTDRVNRQIENGVTDRYSSKFDALDWDTWGIRSRKGEFEDKILTVSGADHTKTVEAIVVNMIELKEGEEEKEEFDPDQFYDLYFRFSTDAATYPTCVDNTGAMKKLFGFSTEKDVDGNEVLDNNGKPVMDTQYDYYIWYGTEVNISTLSFDEIADQTYTRGAIKPAVVVKNGLDTLTEGTHYTVVYTNNVNAGTATATVKAKEGSGFSGSKELTFTILPKNVSGLTIAAIKAQTYTGKALSPALTVKDGSAVLSLKNEYTVAYKNNVNPGTATATITGTGNYIGSKSVNFTIQKPVSSLTVAAIAPQMYTGKAITPTVTVKDGSALKLNTDYTVAYQNNVKVGTATVTITGKGKYSGVKKVTFTIVANKVNGVKAKAASYNTVTVSWTALANVDGYTIYRSNKKTSGYKAIATVKGASVKSYNDTKAVTGSVNYYKVVPYLGKTKGVDSNIVSAKPAFGKVKIASVKNTAKKTVVVSWKKVSGAKGYEVYRATSKNGKYSKIGTSTGTSYTDKKAATGKTYYYKVRPYGTSGSKKVYGDYSDVKNVKSKK